MGCGSCTSQGCSPKGCKNNGGCSSGGCNRLNTFDWLKDMEDPQFFPHFGIVEVRFKGGRKEFCLNKERLNLTIGDAIIIEAQSGKHMGYVSLTGELVRLQMKKRNATDESTFSKIVRIANEKDLEKAEKAREREGTTLYRARALINIMNLNMKLSDVEFQADNTKATFYYSSDERVDFRELIKKLAEEFKIRVEMKQISLRHEAARLGGIGSCGRELCCSTWLSDFQSVTTQAARYQNLSINPQKLSGQCGRLKCCLNYELDTYKEAWEGIPEISKPLKTTKGMAFLQKTDIFKKIMWFSFEGDSDWHPLSVENAVKILELNEKGQTPEFNALIITKPVLPENEKVEETVRLEGGLNRMENRKKRQKQRNNRSGNRNNRNKNNKK